MRIADGIIDMLLSHNVVVLSTISSLASRRATISTWLAHIAAYRPLSPYWLLALISTLSISLLTVSMSPDSQADTKGSTLNMVVGLLARTYLGLSTF